MTNSKQDKIEGLVLKYFIISFYYYKDYLTQLKMSYPFLVYVSLNKNHLN